MYGSALYELYEKLLLPQFGIKNLNVTWLESENVGPDETVHYFSIESVKYALIFEDHGGLGATKEFIMENVRLEGRTYEFIIPTSQSSFTPSYPIKFPVPYMYCVNVTGMFTLILI